MCLFLSRRLKLQIQCKKVSSISWTHWFKKMLYYQVALVYTLTRLVTNVSQALLAFYVTNELGMGQSSKALEIRWSGWRLKAFFNAGAILWMFSGAGVSVLPDSMHNLMYILSIAIGAANALMTELHPLYRSMNALFDVSIDMANLKCASSRNWIYPQGGFSLVSHFLFFPRQVTGISMESMLVGENLNGCAFVYGSLSFVDKLSCGLALFVLESYQGKRVTSFPIRSPPDNNIFSSGSPDVMGNLGSNVSHSVNRYGLGVIPATCAFVSAVITYTMELPDTTSSRTLVEPLLA
ncbi:hypothetical protein BHE74_00015996 [Ensete ventricosum]|nr:hypothetical protein BHE74_00015996 [Ensete ventricosum]RZR89914.1 hypothetical protein BHM03_00017731 [Ensete ventricosum]